MLRRAKSFGLDDLDVNISVIPNRVYKFDEQGPGDGLVFLRTQLFCSYEKVSACKGVILCCLGVEQALS